MAYDSQAPLPKFLDFAPCQFIFFRDNCLEPGVCVLRSRSNNTLLFRAQMYRSCVRGCARTNPIPYAQAAFHAAKMELESVAST